MGLEIPCDNRYTIGAIIGIARFRFERKLKGSKPLVIGLPTLPRYKGLLSSSRLVPKLNSATPPTGFKPVTSGLKVQHSYRLSYNGKRPDRGSNPSSQLSLRERPYLIRTSDELTTNYQIPPPKSMFSGDKFKFFNFGFIGLSFKLSPLKSGSLR